MHTRVSHWCKQQHRLHCSHRDSDCRYHM